MRCLALALALLVSSGVAWPQSYPPPYPREGATKVLENERVVVWDVSWEEGLRTPMHEHRLTVLSVDLIPGQVKSILPDGTIRTGQPQPVGSVLYGGKGLVHREEGASETPRRAIVIELKELQPEAIDEPEGIPLAWPREGARKVLENERVVVWDYEFRPERRVPLHFHDKDTVVVELEPGRTRSVPRNGEPTEGMWLGNRARFAPRGRIHREELVDGTPRAIIVELR